MWKSESDFVKHITKLLKAHPHVEITRIESGGTKNGIPDMFVSTMTNTYWIEFKNMKYSSIHDKEWKVTWRPGQQNFLMMNSIKRKVDNLTVKFLNFTIIGMKDGIVIIPMDYFYIGNVVKADDPLVYKWPKITFDLVYWLNCHSVLVVGSSLNKFVHDDYIRIYRNILKQMYPVDVIAKQHKIVETGLEGSLQCLECVKDELFEAIKKV